MQKFLITIVGPTAIGKTALSIQLAQKLNCEIISCDSRQFFKEMKIGTAVPSNIELAAAKHHFIQNKTILENYSVGDFEKEAIAKINELFTKSNYAIMVGGSGLYVDAVLKGLDNFPEIDTNIRNSIKENFNTHGINYLQDQLKNLDQEYYTFILKNNPQTLSNPQRLMRFLEVCISTGLPYSSFLNNPNKKRNFSPIIIGLDAERDIIYDRINKRVDIMINEGLLLEAEKLINFKHLNALQTVGYKELFQYFDNEITLENAIEEIKKNTRRFSKRQLTWFKRNEQTQWFDFKTDFDLIFEYITNKSK